MNILIYTLVFFPIAAAFLSYLLGSVLHMGVIGIAVAMCFDWTAQALLYIRRLRSGKWKYFRVVT